MQKILGVMVIVSVLIILPVISYFSVIVMAVTGVIMVFLLCITVLMLSFTWSRAGAWRRQRRLIVAGEIVVYFAKNGQVIHLSAIHEQAKAAHPVTVKEAKPTADEGTVLELHSKGMSLRSIAQACGLKYHQVQKITAQNSD